MKTFIASLIFVSLGLLNVYAHNNGTPHTHPHDCAHNPDQPVCEDKGK